MFWFMPLAPPLSPLSFVVLLSYAVALEVERRDIEVEWMDDSSG